MGQALVGGLDLGLQRFGQWRFDDPAANLGADLGELSHVVDIEAGQRLGDPFAQPGLRQELAKGRGGGRESAGDLHTLGAELRDHFAERSVLAANLLDIAHAQAIEPDHPFLLCHLRRSP